MFDATRSQALHDLLLRLADLHLTAAQAAGNDAAERIAAELALASDLISSGSPPAAQSRLQASIDTMLDAVQAQDRVSQTLQLAQRMIDAATLARSGAGEQTDGALLADLARRSQSVQPELHGDVTRLIEQHLDQQGSA